jgi:dolichol-phosphate mannosyltransferase
MNPLRLSIVIPAHNEAENLPDTIGTLARALCAASIPHEIVVVDDHSTDGTAQVVEELCRRTPDLRLVRNERPGGFGQAVRAGIDAFRGDALCLVMADASDDPGDVVEYYRKLCEGYECVFGSRFTRHSRVVNYPPHKLVLNRLANLFIRLLFGLRYNDVTNAFKCYRRTVIEGVQPILSYHFNLLVELPLKAIVRGYAYTVVPTHWYGRQRGISKLRIREMGSRYLFIVLYVFLERLLSRGDYRRAGASPVARLVSARPTGDATGGEPRPVAARPPDAVGPRT